MSAPLLPFQVTSSTTNDSSQPSQLHLNERLSQLSHLYFLTRQQQWVVIFSIIIEVRMRKLINTNYGEGKNQAPGRIRTHDLSVVLPPCYNGCPKFLATVGSRRNFWVRKKSEIGETGKETKKNWINRFHRKNNEWPKLASEASREVKSFSATKKFEAFLAPR